MRRKLKEKSERRTLGSLAHEAIDSLFRKESPRGEFADLTTEVWFTLSIVVQGGPEVQCDMRAQLKNLVDGRNQLIHHMFGGFDPRSPESCAALEAKLDAQCEQIAVVFRWIEGVVIGMRELAAEAEKQTRELET